MKIIIDKNSLKSKYSDNVIYKAEYEFLIAQGKNSFPKPTITKSYREKVPDTEKQLIKLAELNKNQKIISLTIKLINIIPNHQ